MTNKYSCIERNGTPSSIVETQRGTIELIVWKSNFFKNSGWNPKSRCQEVSYRFQKFSDAGELKYITTGEINGYNVICVADPKKPQPNVCKNDGLLITLEPGDDPQQVRNEIFDISARVKGGGYTRGCPNNEASIWNFRKLINDPDCLPTINLNTNTLNSPNNNPQTQPNNNPIEQPQTPDNNGDVLEIDPLFSN
jgi:hypothetical protein